MLLIERNVGERGHFDQYFLVYAAGWLYLLHTETIRWQYMIGGIFNVSWQRCKVCCSAACEDLDLGAYNSAYQTTSAECFIIVFYTPGSKDTGG